jgi:murein DD-endopeptidase MepM/ murein hydrolase activator NlpD
MENKPRKKFLKKLKNKYRLVILHEATFAEKFSLLLSPLNVIVTFSVMFLVITAMVVSAIVFTPLKEFIPGYSDTSVRSQAIANAELAESLEKQSRVNAQYLENVRKILAGEPMFSDTLFDNPQDVQTEKIQFSRSVEDSLLRVRIEQEEKYNVSFEDGVRRIEGELSGLYFFSPLRGTVTSSFDPLINHLGVDLVAPKNEAVKAVLDGTVVLSTWTTDGGFTIQIQHANNLVSVYKHNAVLLKKEGDAVKAGDSIAIVGNSGELTDGPHLHFKLLHLGTPLNPEDFIVFN